MNDVHSRVCECMCVQVCVPICMAETDDWCPWDLSLHLDLNVFAKLSSQSAPGICCLCLLYWDYRWAPKEPTWLFTGSGSGTLSAELSLQIYRLVLFFNLEFFNLESTSGYVWDDD